MTPSLPPNPSLENLKKQAKTLQKKWRSGDAQTFARIRAVHPQYVDASDEQLQRRQAPADRLPARAGARSRVRELAANEGRGAKRRTRNWPSSSWISHACATTIRTTTTARFMSAPTRCCRSIRSWRRPTSGRRRRPATRQPSDVSDEDAGSGESSGPARLGAADLRLLFARQTSRAAALDVRCREIAAGPWRRSQRVHAQAQ